MALQLPGEEAAGSSSLLGPGRRGRICSPVVDTIVASLRTSHSRTQQKEIVMVQVCSTGTITINAAFLQEIKEVNQELWQLLAAVRAKCAAKLAPHHIRGVVVLLQDLRDQLALHFALEEAYGYFEDPFDVAPRFCDQADRLRSEHKGLYLDLCQISDQAETFLCDGDHELLAKWLTPRFISFDIRLKQHESRENELIMDAYECDIGCGD